MVDEGVIEEGGGRGHKLLPSFGGEGVGERIAPLEERVEMIDWSDTGEGVGGLSGVDQFEGAP